MHNLVRLLALLGALAGMPAPAFAAPERVTPAIQGYGEVVPLPDAAQPLDPARDYRLVFDVTQTGRSDASPLPGLEAAARFLNLAALSGVPADRLHLVMVIHGAGTAHALGHARFNGIYGRDNPSLPLIRQLVDHGVTVYVCGQALAGAGFEQAWVADEVTVAVAALTVLANHQLDGYALMAY